MMERWKSKMFWHEGTIIPSASNMQVLNSHSGIDGWIAIRDLMTNALCRLAIYIRMKVEGGFLLGIRPTVKNFTWSSSSFNEALFVHFITYHKCHLADILSDLVLEGSTRSSTVMFVYLCNSSRRWRLVLSSHVAMFVYLSGDLLAFVRLVNQPNISFGSVPLIY